PVATRAGARGFALGAALGVALGLALAFGAQRWSASRPGEPVEPASPRAAAVAPPAVAAPPPPPLGVSVNADPWAHVEVDGAPVGETPIAELPVPPGLHRFTARMPDGRVLEREVVIDERNRRVLFP
ncbi:MAG: hypothetical protein DCC71_17660, partial [Proteobacteria bacterium]